MRHLKLRCNLKYGVMTCALLCFASVIGRVSASELVWIDTDPSCGHERSNDVDDCWALLLALRSNELTIKGISTVFGNGSEETSYTTVVDLVKRFADTSLEKFIYRGENKAVDMHDPEPNSATEAMAAALNSAPLTIVALGPLTNIAKLMLNHPELVANIRQVIAVAGQRTDPGIGFYPGSSRLFHLHDMNFRKDVSAFEVVLASGVPITLLPYEIAAKIVIRADDLDSLAEGGAESQWLEQTSRPWLEFWQTTLQAEGFFPFDSLAVGVLIFPTLYTCDDIPAMVQRKRAIFVSTRDRLHVSHDFNQQPVVRYCHDVDYAFKNKLIERILVN